MATNLISRSLCKCLAALGFGIFYIYGLIHGAGYFLGAGHGSELVMKLVTTPLEIGPLIWICVLIFAAFAEHKILRFAGVTLLLVHYVALTVQIDRSEISTFLAEQSSLQDKTIILVMISVCIVTNIALWMRFILAGRNAKKPRLQESRA